MFRPAGLPLQVTGPARFRGDAVPDEASVATDAAFSPTHDPLSGSDGAFCATRGTFPAMHAAFLPTHGTFWAIDGTFLPMRETFGVIDGTFLPMHGTFSVIDGAKSAIDGTFSDSTAGLSDSAPGTRAGHDAGAGIAHLPRVISRLRSGSGHRWCAGHRAGGGAGAWR